MVCSGQINWNFIWIMKLAHAQQAEFFCIKRFLIRFFLWFAGWVFEVAPVWSMWGEGLRRKWGGIKCAIIWRQFLIVWKIVGKHFPQTTKLFQKICNQTFARVPRSAKGEGGRQRQIDRYGTGELNLSQALTCGKGKTISRENVNENWQLRCAAKVSGLTKITHEIWLTASMGKWLNDRSTRVGLGGRGKVSLCCGRKCPGWPRKIDNQIANSFIL